MTSTITQTASAFQPAFERLFADIQADPARLAAFFANPQPYLVEAGIPVLPEAPPATAPDGAPQADTLQLGANGYQLDVQLKWWGIDLVMNETLTQAIATGAILGGPLASLIASAIAASGLVAAPVAAVIGAAIGTAIAAKIVEIKLVSQGNGVHWPITWPQWAPVIGAVPYGPAAVLAALLVFIHPLAN